jgi:hypothetical protein
MYIWEIGSFQKRSTLPPWRKFLPSAGGGEKKMFLIIVNVLGHPKGVGGLTSNFLCGGGIDVFWNDPKNVIKVIFWGIFQFKKMIVLP